MSDHPTRYLPVKAIAARFGCHPATVWDWTARGLFPKPVKIGGMTRWLAEEVEAHERRAEAQREAA